MKKYFFLFCASISMDIHAQIQQNINKPSGMVSNAISGIDSIRFNTAGDEMQVVLQNGQVELHQIIEIDSVTFATTPNPLAHSCGADSVHNPALTYGSMTDQEGNVYKTIVIGSQEWMAENLNTGIYRNGEAIANVIDNNEWSILTSGAWCYFNNESSIQCPYGKLYNWYAVNDSRNICPVGWHVPTDDEWSTMINVLDPNADGGNNTPNTAGSKMKSIGLLYYLEGNQDATNESGFSGLPGGNRSISGLFSTFFGRYGNWWSSTSDGTFAYYRNVYYNPGDVDRSSNLLGTGFSVRCLRD
jgi:uncharacterized protein (TIGR02145 family)